MSLAGDHKTQHHISPADNLSETKSREMGRNGTGAETTINY